MLCSLESPVLVFEDLVHSHALELCAYKATASTCLNASDFYIFLPIRRTYQDKIEQDKPGKQFAPSGEACGNDHE